jgi:gluconolactonase
MPAPRIALEPPELGLQRFRAAEEHTAPAVKVVRDRGREPGPLSGGVKYEGQRLNSPNDLVYKSDGALYFTDPPFGLPKFFDDPRKELAYSGVFRVADGKVQLLTTDLTGPNGLAFSPDEKFFYVDDWDVKKKVVMRYRVEPDGTLSHGEVFFDMTSEPGEQALDGMKIDQKGNLYVSGPGGVWIVSPGAKHLGTIKAPELPANFALGASGARRW